MHRNAIVLGSVLLLAGCAQAYDRDALPDAAVALHQEVFACEAKQTGREVRNYSEYAACLVAAERNFATAIHLTHMDAFEVYAARMLALAADRDTRQLSLEETRTRAADIRKDYWAACACNITGRRLAHSGNNCGGGDTFYNGAGMAGGGLAASGVIFSW
jgi:hypothetical protein